MYRKFYRGIIIFIFFASLFSYIFFRISDQTLDATFTELPMGVPERVDLFPNTIFEESFYRSRDYLTGVSIKMHNFYPRHQGTLYITLRDGSSEIISHTSNIFSLLSHRFHDISFGPLEGSQGKKYTLQIYMESESPYPMALYMYEDNNTSHAATLDAKPLSRHLYFYSRYTNPSPQTVGKKGWLILLERISQYKPFFFKGFIIVGLIGFYVLMALIYILKLGRMAR